MIGPHESNEDNDLVSCDIVSLYTSILHELGITAMEYYIEKYRNLIPSRFTQEFIIESAQFVLQNNNFIFDNTMYHQKKGTAMGTKFAPPYACLAIGYLEEFKLFPVLLPLHFNQLECKRIENCFFRFMDDGFILWSNSLDINIFKRILNELHPAIKFEFEHNVTEMNYDRTFIKTLNFLDVKIILHESGKIETDIYYKSTNNHQYLDFYSHHPRHTKSNIPYNLAKRIVVFVSDPVIKTYRLNELKNWLLQCNYSLSLIKSSFFKAHLQGPANKPQPANNTIPFVSTFFSNLDCQRTVNTCNERLQSSTNVRIKEAFKDTKVVLSLKQPPNILKQLTRAEFTSIPKEPIENGLFKCKSKRCKICLLYLQECKSFICANNVEWFIKSHITCRTRCAIYYLECVPCNGETTYTGKTNMIRSRTNNHISDIFTGRTTDIFDQHVHRCRIRNNYYKEPYFRLFVFMELHDEKLLLPYESYFHRNKYDTMN